MVSEMERLRQWLLTQMMRAARRGLLRFVPDALYLKIQYYLKLGERLNLKRPVLYNEKLQWIKLYDREARYATFVDKIDVRTFVSGVIGDTYLIPAIQMADRAEDIDWASLPNRFVLKCTHGSSCNIICRDKTALDIDAAMGDIRAYMRRNWFDTSREWPYKDVKPRILIEEFLESGTGDVPLDYKIMCFHGKPYYIIVDVDRYQGHKRNYYDPDWNLVPIFNRHPNYDGDIPRPEKLDEMLKIAEKLSKGLRHIRIDLYAILGKVYFGEMTFFHGYGMEVFRPRDFERHMGDLIEIGGEKQHEKCIDRKP